MSALLNLEHLNIKRNGLEHVHYKKTPAKQHSPTDEWVKRPIQVYDKRKNPDDQSIKQKVKKSSILLFINQGSINLNHNDTLL